jgi:hypothetical protein
MYWLKSKNIDKEYAIKIFDNITGLTFIGFVLGVIDWLVRNFVLIDEIILDTGFLF